jgi:hypothetical protein
MRPWKDLAFDYIGGERETERKRDRKRDREKEKQTRRQTIGDACKLEALYRFSL